MLKTFKDETSAPQVKFVHEALETTGHQVLNIMEPILRKQQEI